MVFNKWIKRTFRKFPILPTSKNPLIIPLILIFYKYIQTPGLGRVKVKGEAKKENLSHDINDVDLKI